jgi:hypothetical protein
VQRELLQTAAIHSCDLRCIARYIGLDTTRRKACHWRLVHIPVG